MRIKSLFLKLNVEDIAYLKSFDFSLKFGILNKEVCQLIFEKAEEAFGF